MYHGENRAFYGECIIVELNGIFGCNYCRDEKKLYIRFPQSHNVSLLSPARR